jgi:hypothetical protein
MVATRVKEEKGRVGGPPSGFKPKGKRATPAAKEVGPARRRRQAPESSATGPARATRILVIFGPNDPRYQGLTYAEQVGDPMELLDPLKTGLLKGDVVRRRRSWLFMQMSFPPKRPRPREAQQEARVEGLPTYLHLRKWRGSRCQTGRPNGINGTSTLATKIIRAGWTPPSSLGRSRQSLCSMWAIGSHGGLDARSPRGACSTSKTSSQRWSRAKGKSTPPTIRATQRGWASSSKGPTGNMGRGGARTRDLALGARTLELDYGLRRRKRRQRPMN